MDDIRNKLNILSINPQQILDEANQKLNMLSEMKNQILDSKAPLENELGTPENPGPLRQAALDLKAQLEDCLMELICGIRSGDETDLTELWDCIHYLKSRMENLTLALDKPGVNHV